MSNLTAYKAFVRVMQSYGYNPYSTEGTHRAAAILARAMPVKG